MGIPIDILKKLFARMRHAASLQGIAWITCCILAALTFLVYLVTSVHIGQGEIIMPLDDAYIHFQYTRQMANGQPYVYNPGDPPTSGATSFIYPYVLAIGYVLGFKGLSLGLWAMGIGAVALLAAAWMIYLLIKAIDSPFWLALLFAAVFTLNGAVAWHFMSGMETGVVMALVLATLYMLMSQRFRGLMITASLLAVSRPEGSMMAVIVLGGIALQGRFPSWIAMCSRVPLRNRAYWWITLPILSVVLQPAVNLIITGSLSSTGGRAKSIFGMIPFYWDVVVCRIWDNFTRMWSEFATGTDGYYLPMVVPMLALIGLIYLLTQRKYRMTALVVLGWLVVISAAIATLDTAFWHFKRYQMPLMVLFFPLAGWGINVFFVWVRQQFVIENIRTNRPIEHLNRIMRRIHAAALVLLVIFLVLPTLLTSTEFLRLYDVNLHNMMAQPYPMARWLAENTPEDAVIAVHDVGMMRYVGNRYTIDMVGLTTPSAADAWRNGPGSVAEFLMSYDPHPDYVAAYTTARGLNYLADTSIYGSPIVGFLAQYNPSDNVALAAEFQGIYRYYKREKGDLFSTTVQGGLALLALAWAGNGFVWEDDPTEDWFTPAIADTLDVANTIDETEHSYHWFDREQQSGFPTEVYELESYSCAWDLDGEFGNLCAFADGGRRINGEETFTMNSTPNRDAVLVNRIHAVIPGTLEVYANENLVDTQWIPSIPGKWFDIATYIPKEYIAGDNTRFRIVVDTPRGYYMPYYHWLLQGDYNFPVEAVREMLEMIPVQSASYQDNAFTLATAYHWDDMTKDVSVEAEISTEGHAEGDYKLFVHIYGDINQEPVGQIDTYLNTLPGNWLPGTISDTFVVDLSQVSPGTYQVAVGFYNPYTFERLMPTAVSDRVWVDEASQRLFIGQVEIPDDE